MSERIITPEEAVEIILDVLDAVPMELRVDAAVTAINRFAEEGYYDVSAACLRRGGAPESEIYERVMWWAEQRGDDVASVFELVWGLPALIE